VASPIARLRTFRRTLVAVDVCSLIAALMAVHLLTPGRVPLPRPIQLTLVVGPVIWIVLFQAFGLYERNGLSRPSVWEEMRRIISATSVGVLVVSIAGAWWDQPVNRTSITWFFLFALSFELLARWLVRSSLRREKQEGRLAMRTLVVGANEEAHGLARQLELPGGWFTPVGSVTLTSGSTDDPSLDLLPVVGHIDELEEAIRRNAADCVFVASTAVAPEEVLRISQACRRADAELRLTANVTDVLTSRLSVDSVDGVTSIAFRPVRLTETQAGLKRGLDLLVAPIALALSVPVLVVIAFAIKLSSPGPVLFCQERVTKDGRRFTMYKLRTMTNDPERALDGNVIDLTRPFFKMEDDPRLTWVGRLLRSFSLDELPQLWNVIRGDMSLVGPRPLPSEQVAAHEAFLSPRHEVRSGLTGLWQVSGRSELDSEEALRLDRFYIDNWSLGLDLYILLKTAVTVVTRRGAH
jgi:exopolysaccharide biosynthesis polyprenyl glycosylphosphotransferase